MFLFLRTTVLGLILAIAAIGIISVSAESGNLLNGTWDLNLEKSTFTNTSAPKSETRTYESTGQQDKMTSERITADGKVLTMQYSANLDGKDYPYTGSPVSASISLSPVDAFTTNYTMKGKVAGGGARVVSKDGKTLTISFEGTNPNGQPMKIISVFEKR